MGFRFSFGTNRKTDMKDDSLLDLQILHQQTLLKWMKSFRRFSKDNLDTPFFKEDKSYLQNGVHMENAQNTFKLVYDGLLAQNGSNEIHAVVAMETTLIGKM